MARRKGNVAIDIEIEKPASLAGPLRVREKRLLGAGPSNPPETVLRALGRPMMGHLHPETLQIMDEIKEGLQYVFQTSNPLTLCVSASGHGGMEAALCNLIEDGDVVLCGVTGLWGNRAGDMAARYGGDVRYIEAGSASYVLTLDRVRDYFEIHRPKIFFITQGDSSTGVLQQIDGLGDLCRQFDCLLVVDTVASLGGTPFYQDKWMVDVVYSGSQKVLGAPPGLAPISFGQRALNKVLNRTSQIKVYYWDILLLGDYWGCFGRPRIYHHTVSATLLYGLREALALIVSDGIAETIRRHEDAAAYLYEGLANIGLELYVTDPEARLPSITSVKLPKNCDGKRVIDFIAKEHALEIAGGLGPTAGQIFRIGLMGENAKRDYVDLVLGILNQALEVTCTSKL